MTEGEDVDEPLTIVDCTIHGHTEAFAKRIDVPGWPGVVINRCLRCEYPLRPLLIAGLSS